MVTIAKDLLPGPGEVADIMVQQRRRSATLGMLMTNVPDPALRPRQWVFSWLNVSTAVADAIRRHYREHNRTTFPVELPRTAEVVTVQWATGPRTSWSTAISASVIAELREVLAHE